MKTIDTMKQALIVLEANGRNFAAQTQSALRDAIKREEAQTVGPVAWIYADTAISLGGTRPDERSQWMPLFTRPAPQPSGERSELIESQNRIAENGANQAMRDLARKTADMLAADAQRIVELEALSVTNIMIDIVPGDGSGHEVYAKSVGEVVDVLTYFSEKLDAQSGCTRSHPHEAMSKMCELRIEIDRLTNQLAQQVEVPQGTWFEDLKFVQRVLEGHSTRQDLDDALEATRRARKSVHAIILTVPQPPQQMAVPQGYAIVPKIPTNDMMMAASLQGGLLNQWASMIAAASQTSQADRVPMTDEEIIKAGGNFPMYLLCTIVSLAREVEAHHGIRAKP